MNFLKNKNSERKLDHSRLIHNASFEFESVISEIDIEKQMTEYTFKKIIS